MSDNNEKKIGDACPEQSLLQCILLELADKTVTRRQEAGIFIFGAGQVGQSVLRHLVQCNAYNIHYKVKGFLDNDSSKQGMNLNGILVFAPQRGTIGPEDFIIITSDTYGYEIMMQLLELGVDKEKIILPGNWLEEILNEKRDEKSIIVKASSGYCPCCDKNTWFVAKHEWLRDCYVCQYCNSIPRQRAIINRIKEYVPDISQKSIYEAAPCGASSLWLRNNAGSYISSQYWFDRPLGAKYGKYVCQNLESLTFEDCTFDLVVTQDVFEHIFCPDKAFREIGRVLKPGGYHIFTLPFYRGTNTSVRARINDDGIIEHLKEPVFHGNPISKDGSLVTFDWGEDITGLIFKWTGMVTTIYVEKNAYYGLEAEFLEVFISRKTDN